MILYSTNCPQCKVLESKLNAAGFTFEIRTDLEEMLQLGMQSAPALLVDNKLMTFKAALEWLQERESVDHED